ncbi:MAG: hypothetical protein SW019_19970 [Actinomycetota bacterium]|nr:hypothetical protein [Actinomycetota bacterium]
MTYPDFRAAIGGVDGAEAGWGSAGGWLIAVAAVLLLMILAWWISRSRR